MWNASLTFHSLFQLKQSIALMPCQSISCGANWSWACLAMTDLELCPSLIKVSPTYSPEHVLHFTEYTVCLAWKNVCLTPVVRAMWHTFWLRPSTNRMITVIGRGSFIVCFCRLSAQLVVCHLIWMFTTLLMNCLGQPLRIMTSWMQPSSASLPAWLLLTLIAQLARHATTPSIWLEEARGSSGETSRKTMLVTGELGYPI